MQALFFPKFGLLPIVIGDLLIEDDFTGFTIAMYYALHIIPSYATLIVRQPVIMKDWRLCSTIVLT
jgi:hypothetical protein